MRREGEEREEEEKVEEERIRVVEARETDEEVKEDQEKEGGGCRGRDAGRGGGEEVRTLTASFLSFVNVTDSGGVAAPPTFLPLSALHSLVPRLHTVKKKIKIKKPRFIGPSTSRRSPDICSVRPARHWATLMPLSPAWQSQAAPLRLAQIYGRGRLSDLAGRDDGELGVAPKRRVVRANELPSHYQRPRS